MMYTFVRTRCNITFTVSTLSRFLESLGETHCEVLVRLVFRYLAVTKGLAPTYGAERHDLVGYLLGYLTQMGHCRSIVTSDTIFDRDITIPRETRGAERPQRIDCMMYLYLYTRDLG